VSGKTIIDITKQTVDGLKPGEKEYFAWDKMVTGFAVRVRPASARYPSGTKTFIYNYRNATGRPRRMKLGRMGMITPKQARDLARDYAHSVAKGIDPQAIVQAKRQAISVNEFEEVYFERYANDRKRPRSIQSDRALFRLHIVPRLGKLTIEEITSRNIQDLHHAMKGTPGAANRTVALLSKMFNLAEKWGFRPEHSNPCSHIEKYNERTLERYLSDVEFARLGETLVTAEEMQTEMPSVIAAIRLLMFTGCRLGEILSLRWEDVKLDEGCLRFAATNTKENKPKTVYLNPASMEVLQSLMSKADNLDASPWVIRGHKRGEHLVNLRKPWHRIRKDADIDGVRLHDLRHSFASMAAAGGMSLPMIGKLLGHTQTQTTARYAHLADDPAKRAAAQVGNHIAAAMSGRPSADIIDLKKKL
jgi:integrase